MDGKNKLLFFNPSKTQKNYVTFSEDQSPLERETHVPDLELWIKNEKIKVSELHSREFKEFQQAVHELKTNNDLSAQQLQKDIQQLPWSKLLKSYQAIYSKQKDNFEDRNVDTCFLAIDFLTWTRPDPGPDPRSPLVLVPIKIKPLGRGQSDFLLEVIGEAQINDVLLVFLRNQFKVEAPNLAYSELATLREAAANLRHGLPDGKVERCWTIYNFMYLQMPMVRDLETIEDQIEQGLIPNNVVLSLAGEDIEGEINEPLEEADIWQVLEDSAENEFLIFSTDYSQHRAITAVAKGQNLVIQGPPGTGKSQTIANCIADLSASGKRVLFVAEKRAAIDAVVSRLAQKNLDSLVLDLHGEPSRRTIAAQLLQLVQMEHKNREAKKELRARLDDVRQVVQRRWELLHQKLSITDFDGEPITLYQLLMKVSSVQQLDTSGRDLPTGISGVDLASVGATACREIGAALERLQEIGWLDPTSGFNSLSGLVDDVRTKAQSAELVENLQILQDQRDAFLSEARIWADRDGLAFNTLEELLEDVKVVDQIKVLASRWDLKDVKSLMDQEKYLTREAYFKRHKEMNLIERYFAWRSMDKDYRSCYVGGDHLDKEAQRREIKRLGKLISQRLNNRPTRPLLPASSPASLKTKLQTLSSIQSSFKRYGDPLGGLFSMPVEEAYSLALTMLKNEELIEELPLISSVRQEISDMGDFAINLLSWFESNKPRHLSAESWLTRCFYEEVLRLTLDQEPFTGLQELRTIDKASDTFRTSDNKHIEENANRLLRTIYERFDSELSLQNSSGYQLLKKESMKKRSHRPFRDLMEQASEVIFAIKPCFASSPLNVSKVLPCIPGLFDVVIFDEASQIRPADSIPAIYRGKQIVVAGDRHQLAPTDVFRRDDDEDDEHPLEFAGTEMPATAGLESILDAMQGVLLGTSIFPLSNHYRSKHEKLISFSNRSIYTPNRQPLLTFPSVLSASDAALTYEYVQDARTSGIDEANTKEITAVIDAIRSHASARPQKSLGVIAFGERHATRIRETLQMFESEDDLFYEFVQRHDAGTEPLFVKNIERVQGDERDFVIISPGYAPDNQGKVHLRFGSLNTEGGERRLNVAASRAKEGMHLITSLKSSDLNLQRSQARGVHLFRTFLEFMESGGNSSVFGDPIASPETPFEQSILDRLTKEGLSLECQVGDSGYRIDFAVRHPERPGSFVLAIEADGASYHSSRYARERDRLRQEILEERGWHFVRIWSTDWFRDPKKQVQKVLDAYKKAL